MKHLKAFVLELVLSYTAVQSPKSLLLKDYKKGKEKKKSLNKPKLHYNGIG